MFVVTTEHRFTWPVKVRLPDAAAAGKIATFEFEGAFRLMSEDEAVGHADRLGATRTSAAAVAATKDQIRAMLVGWDNQVVDAEKKPIAFSAEALEECMKLHAFRAAVLDAYGAALSGRPAPAEGN